jgi:hypothetical protein
MTETERALNAKRLEKLDQLAQRDEARVIEILGRFPIKKGRCPVLKNSL